MLMNNFLRDRKSTRDFKNRKLDSKTLRRVEGLCHELGDDGYEFIFLEDGDRIFRALEGVGGYSGVMIRSPHYIAVNIVEADEENIIHGAYETECLITELTSLNMGSCWISLGDVERDLKESLFNIDEGHVDYMLAIGYPANKNPFAPDTISSRIGIEDIVYDGSIGRPVTIEQLEHRGLDDLFYYVRFAPSAYNRQPWRFVLEDDRVILYLAYSREEELSLVDGGIIMYYFESLARTIGISGQWILGDERDLEEGECKYRYIAMLRL